MSPTMSLILVVAVLSQFKTNTLRPVTVTDFSSTAKKNITTVFDVIASYTSTTPYDQSSLGRKHTLLKHVLYFSFYISFNLKAKPMRTNFS